MAMEAFTRTHGILIRQKNKRIMTRAVSCIDQLQATIIVHLILFKVVSQITMIDIFNFL